MTQSRYPGPLAKDALAELRPHLNVTEGDIAELGRRLDAALARVGKA
jgi:hypothetical protein